MDENKGAAARMDAYLGTNLSAYHSKPKKYRSPGTVQEAMSIARILNAVPEDAPVGEEGAGYVVYEEDGSVIASSFIGTVFALDPCGRYHHFLSPNGATAKCERYWESLERQLEKRGLSLTSGEGDPCDQYVERYLRDLGDDEGNEDNDDEDLHEFEFDAEEEVQA